MAICAVELYERLKPRLGETEAKELLEYVDELVRDVPFDRAGGGRGVCGLSASQEPHSSDDQ